MTEYPRYEFPYNYESRTITTFVGYIGEYDLYVHRLWPTENPISAWLVLTKGLPDRRGVTHPRPREIEVRRTGDAFASGWHREPPIVGLRAQAVTSEDRQAFYRFLLWIGAKKVAMENGDALERLR